MESGWSLGPRLPTPRGGSTSKQRRGGPGSGRWERTRWVLECPCPGGGGGWWQGPGASQRPRHSAGGRAGPGPGWGAGRPTRRRPRFCSSGVTGRREGVGERGDSSPGHRRLWNSVYFHPQQTRRALVAEWGTWPQPEHQHDAPLSPSGRGPSGEAEGGHSAGWTRHHVAALAGGSISAGTLRTPQRTSLELTQLCSQEQPQVESAGGKGKVRRRVGPPPWGLAPSRPGWDSALLQPPTRCSPPSLLPSHQPVRGALSPTHPCAGGAQRAQVTCPRSPSLKPMLPRSSPKHWA